MKKMLAFLFLYFGSGILGEAVIIAGLAAAGYDPVHGEMPSGEIANLIRYYGFGIYLIMVIVLLGIIMGMAFVCGGISFRTVEENISLGYAIAIAVLLSAIAFAVSHFSTFFAAETSALWSIRVNIEWK